MKEPKLIRDCQEYVEHKFTDDEKQTLGTELAIATQKLQELENAKKSSASDYKSKIDKQMEENNRLARKISNGFETREIDAECRLHDPIKGKKSFYRKDDGTLIRTASMDVADFQSLQMKIADEDDGSVKKGEFSMPQDEDMP